MSLQVKEFQIGGFYKAIGANYAIWQYVGNSQAKLIYAKGFPTQIGKIAPICNSDDVIWVELNEEEKSLIL